MTTTSGYYVQGALHSFSWERLTAERPPREWVNLGDPCTTRAEAEELMAELQAADDADGGRRLFSYRVEYVSAAA